MVQVLLRTLLQLHPLPLPYANRCRACGKTECPTSPKACHSIAPRELGSLAQVVPPEIRGDAANIVEIG